MGYLKKKTQYETAYLKKKKKKQSTLIRIIRKNKNSPKESRERERVLTVLCGKNMD